MTGVETIVRTRSGYSGLPAAGLAGSGSGAHTGQTRHAGHYFF